MNRLFVILPCYNEEENIEALIGKWQCEKERLLREYGYELRILAVDDGSRDRTKEIISSLLPGNANVQLLAHEVNKGLGGAINTGLCNFASNSEGGDIALIMDADNTHDPKYVYSMIDKLRKSDLDCVIASRYCTDSTITGVPFYRNFLSTGARFFYTAAMRVPGVKDYTCGYRIYSAGIMKKAFRCFGDKLIEERSFACMIELLYKLHKTGGRFGEVPFALRYDLKLGESKMKVFKTIKASVFTTLKLRSKLRNITLEEIYEGL